MMGQRRGGLNMRCVLILTLGTALATGCGWTSAQTKYPSRPPGGITDVATRMVTQELVKSLGQNVIVDNRPGANSIVGVEMVAKSSPDGYTVASVIAAHAANQTLYAKLPY